MGKRIALTLLFSPLILLNGCVLLRQFSETRLPTLCILVSTGGGTATQVADRDGTSDYEELLSTGLWRFFEFMTTVWQVTGKCDLRQSPSDDPSDMIRPDNLSGTKVAREPSIREWFVFGTCGAPQRLFL